MQNLKFGPFKVCEKNNKRLGSCNKILEGEYKDYRYNSFDTRGEKKPISVEEFKKKGTQYLFWSKDKLGCATAYRIWAVYHDINDIKSLKYHLCWSPLAINGEIEESDSDTEYESTEEY